MATLEVGVGRPMGDISTGDTTSLGLDGGATADIIEGDGDVTAGVVATVSSLGIAPVRSCCCAPMASKLMENACCCLDTNDVVDEEVPTVLTED